MGVKLLLRVTLDDRGSNGSKTIINSNTIWD